MHILYYIILAGLGLLLILVLMLILALVVSKGMSGLAARPWEEPDFQFKPKGRTLLNPKDRLAVPHSPSTLRAMRLKSERVIKEVTSGSRLPVLTCITCGDVQLCPYAFDVYNIDGDCYARIGYD